jgi:DNA-binding MarR family transcriptional regulator
MEAFYQWLVAGGANGKGAKRRGDFQRYFHGIAKARYVIRKVFRIVDEQAKKAGLDPLEHQALIQIFGADENALRINDVAERLDIPPAFASRLIRSLEEKGLVKRSPSAHDKRTIHVNATAKGRDVLGEIDQSVHLHVDYFQRQLEDVDRAAALGIFAFYVGASPGLDDFRQLERLVNGEEAVARRRQR